MNLPKIDPITTQLLPAPTDADRERALRPFRQLRPEEQSGVAIVNLLSALDGSVTRACMDCGHIFTLPRPTPAGVNRCPACEQRVNGLRCCDAQSHRTIQTRPSLHGPTVAIVVCDGCGRRTEVEL